MTITRALMFAARFLRYWTERRPHFLPRSAPIIRTALSKRKMQSHAEPSEYLRFLWSRTGSVIHGIGLFHKLSLEACAGSTRMARLSMSFRRFGAGRF